MLTFIHTSCVKCEINEQSDTCIHIHVKWTLSIHNNTEVHNNAIIMIHELYYIIYICVCVYTYVNRLFYECL